MRRLLNRLEKEPTSGVQALPVNSQSAERIELAMPINRERLVNAVVYFASNTKYCGKIKLFKLLYLLDFAHFRETGKSVTGADYVAWKFGPVPQSVEEEWEEPAEDFRRAVEIVPEQVIDYVRQTVRPRVPFDNGSFTPRQLRLMERLALQYRDTGSPKMIDVTHEANGAWARIWQEGEGRNHAIPYELALADDDPHREAALQSAREDQMRAAARRAHN